MLLQNLVTIGDQSHSRGIMHTYSLTGKIWLFLFTC